MNQEQIWASIVVAAVAVVIAFIKAAGEAITLLTKARTRTIVATLDGQATEVEAKSETERMGILYMQKLVKDNENLRAENKNLAQANGSLNERVKSREEQLETQSQLKVEAIRRAASMEVRAIEAEKGFTNLQSSVQETNKKLAECDTRLTELLGKYTELHEDVEGRRKDWHDERNVWQSLDSARQTEVQRAKFLARQLNSKLTDEQLAWIKEAASTKGFDYDQFVKAAGSLEMSEIEDLQKENELLKSKIKAP